MAATIKQLADLKAQLLDTPPKDVPFRQVDGSGMRGFIPLSAAEIQQLAVDEARAAAKELEPKPLTLAERVAALEAKV